MTERPFVFTLPLPTGVPTRYDNHLSRPLSSMRGQFLDQAAVDRQLATADVTVYEVYELKGPEVAGELFMGVSVIHPGKIGDEFHMTKGHYHTVRETSEIYYCLKGEGFMVMETSEGETAVEALRPGTVLYVAPSWAHRSVCTSRQDDLVLFFAYPGNAGHDYGTIERSGFRKLVIEGKDGLQIVDNPRWLSG
jgi:glucose-6-phosphate isomerase